DKDLRGAWAIASIIAYGAVERDPDPRFRSLLVRSLREMDDALALLQQDLRLVDGLNHVSWEQEPAAFRRDALLAIRDTDPAKARPIILQLAKQYDGQDRFYLEALGIAVGHHDRARRDVLLAEFDKEFPEWNDKVADLVWELRPPAMMPKLEKILADDKL